MTSSPDDGREWMISLELVESDFTISLWWVGGDVCGDMPGGEEFWVSCDLILSGSLGGVFFCVVRNGSSRSYSSVYSEWTLA